MITFSHSIRARRRVGRLSLFPRCGQHRAGSAGVSADLPQPGNVEHDPGRTGGIAAHDGEAGRSSSHLIGQQIAGLGITNQRDDDSSGTRYRRNRSPNALSRQSRRVGSDLRNSPKRLPVGRMSSGRHWWALLSTRIFPGRRSSNLLGFDRRPAGLGRTRRDLARDGRLCFCLVSGGVGMSMRPATLSRARCCSTSTRAGNGMTSC